MRSSPELDFFRLETGTAECPCVWDDGDLSEQKPKALKAFFGKTLRESMTRERWGASKFEGGCARAGAENPYDASAEPDNTQWLEATGFGQSAVATTQLLVEMLAPTFPKNMSKVNVAALLKRTSVILRTEKFWYRRLAGTNKQRLAQLRVLWPALGFLAPPRAVTSDVVPVTGQ